MATIKVDRGPRSAAFPRRNVSYLVAPRGPEVEGVAEKDAPGAQTATPNVWLTAGIGFVAVVVIVIVALVANQALSDDKFANAVGLALVPGVTVFAVFFVTAQALERLLEPLSAVLLTKDTHTDEYATALDGAEAKLAKWAAATGDAITSAKAAAEAAMKLAAEAKAKLDGTQQNRTILFWAIATVLGIVASAGLKLYFLKTVGFNADYRWVEVLATGLVIGAGTKPLHDLVTTISEKKDQVASASGATTI